MENQDFEKKSPLAGPYKMANGYFYKFSPPAGPYQKGNGNFSISLLPQGATKRANGDYSIFCRPQGTTKSENRNFSKFGPPDAVKLSASLPWPFNKLWLPYYCRGTRVRRGSNICASDVKRNYVPALFLGSYRPELSHSVFMRLSNLGLVDWVMKNKSANW